MRRFSLRSFAKMARSTSPNFLQLIRDRKLNIQSEGVLAFAESLGLTKKETEHFITMAAFDHAKTHEEKDRAFRSMIATREYRSVQVLEKSQYEYFTHWYLPVIRELVTSSEYPGDPAWLSRRIVPAISVSKVRKGIALLERLNLISRDETQGRWIQTKTAISTPSEVVSMALVNYHCRVIALAGESLERFSADSRDIRSVTLGIPRSAYGEIKQRMEAFWKDLLAYADTQANAETVYQVNMQLFPLTGDPKERRQ
ncbi:MAG: hypothetical protein A2350_06895 [Candidatus Raymondbacteria bacterium RifOxyB12_full_50_8]|nr:MAG: hypothetical protein A2350_06895 [Candidatus Raymondbacteria bacterium RifOxyB12_full_50_8]